MLKFVPLLIALPLLAFWVWMLREMLRDERLEGSARSIWIIGFAVGNIVAAALYYMLHYRSRG